MEDFEDDLMELIDTHKSRGTDRDTLISVMELRIAALKEEEQGDG